MSSFLFTSESVTEGHPDKVCDQISDAILDSCLRADPNAHVGVETAIKDNTVILLGEITAHHTLDAEAIARSIIRKIGYDHTDLGFSADSADIKIYISQQSPDIAQGVSLANQEIGAGDQGIMFGYADTQTPQYMPMPIMLAHTLAKRLTAVRKTGILPYLRPDGKTQVTVRYENGQPKEVETVIISAQHHPDVSLEQLRHDIRTHVIDHVIPPHQQAADIKVHINPTGRFVIGGPVGDAGLTGRKIIVDTYGGWARHGGGAFSGKDPTKVDRSAAYAARQAARSVVAAGLADKCEVQLAYAIGIAQPVGIFVDTFGTEKIDKREIEQLLTSLDFRPASIIQNLQLQRPQFLSTAAYGHFGRPTFGWEQNINFGIEVGSQKEKAHLG
jgi:S-adenosylmethionine synthetase